MSDLTDNSRMWNNLLINHIQISKFYYIEITKHMYMRKNFQAKLKEKGQIQSWERCLPPV